MTLTVANRLESFRISGGSHLGYQELCDRLGYAVPRADEVMALLAGRLIGHLDLKEIGYEPEVVALASSIPGPGNFVVTTLEDAITNRPGHAARRRSEIAGGVPGVRGPAVTAGPDASRRRACRG